MAAENRLYDAATNGDVATLQQLLQQDPYLVDEVSFARSRNLLHVATLRGQVAVVEALLRIKPEMCWVRDDQGMNPVHIAAMKGHVEILEEMLRCNPLPAMERVHRGETVLHLCMKHRQFEALRVAVENLEELVCSADDDGETLLHLAVRSNDPNKLEIMEYLMQRNKIEKLTTNSMGKTALNILKESPQSTGIRNLLAKLLDPAVLMIHPKLTDVTMVVVVLIATMAFQAAVSPPGGVWQDTKDLHTAGKAVMASTHPILYQHFSRANTTAFISSLITIFIITIGVEMKQVIVMVIALYTMWVSLTSIAVSFGASLLMTNPMETQPLIGNIVAIVIFVFFGVSLVMASFTYLEMTFLSWRKKTWQRGDPRASLFMPWRSRLDCFINRYILIPCQRMFEIAFRNSPPSQGTVQVA